LTIASVASSVCATSTATAPSTLSLHDALPILSLDETAAAVRLLAERARVVAEGAGALALAAARAGHGGGGTVVCIVSGGNIDARSEEHTSELQSRVDLVCRLLLEKKNERHKMR